MPSPQLGPEDTEIRPDAYSGGSSSKREKGLQPATGDSSTALDHRLFPEKGQQALPRPHATEFKVKWSPSNDKLLEIVAMVAQPCEHN